MTIRRSRLLWANLALYSVLGLLFAVFHAPLRWGLAALPAYLLGGLPSPPEVQLYWKARNPARGKSWEREQARAMLERSLAIDPYGAARFLLAEIDAREGRDDEAIRGYREALRIDPLRGEAWIGLSGIYERRNEPESAIEVLREGLAAISARAEASRPIRVRDVPDKYNEKAVRTYRDLRLAARVLEHEIARLAGG